ncbi:hypothetical protein [Dechloromonas sp. A34]|uniref:hypothetical protein n=1 Tax=Dechloromonas sp. A34 TaxID=447588 RepID=UPI002248B451|nr:hypothetical protein [Dechloromonas sp. A34]
MPNDRLTCRGPFRLRHCSRLAPDFVLNPQSPEGLAVVSLTVSGKPLDKVSSLEFRVRPLAPHGEQVTEATPRFRSAREHTEWMQSERGRRDADWGVGVKVPGAAVPLDVIDHGTPIGRLTTMRLPAGQYEFYAWRLREPDPKGGAEDSRKDTFSYPFVVKAAQATYIGRLNLHLIDRDSEKLTVENRREQDFAVLRKKLPSVGAGQIAVDIGRIQP